MRLPLFVKSNFFIPLSVFAIYILHGANLGMTDDEAYYWVLAQRPSLSYAFHPPAVAWSIALFQNLFSGWLGENHPLVVRFPSALLMSLTVFVSLWWMRLAGAPSDRLHMGGVTLLSFLGFFGGAWMMVPDLPLMFGFSLAFLGTWKLCQCEKENPPYYDYLILGLGIVVSLLSKYSAVLIVVSSFLALWIYAPKPVFKMGFRTLVTASFVGLLPALYWNATHNWGSILYQIQGRHSGDASFIRYFRFWIIELALLGPPLMIYFWILPKRMGFGILKFSVSRFVFLWVLPPACVFLIQPLFSDFKPHWAFVIWLPVAMELGLSVTKGMNLKIAKASCLYGFPLAGLVFVLCHFPIMPLAIEFFSGKTGDPRWDVTNDMYGWRGLRKFVAEELGKKYLDYPLVGSRYQTASQAAFAWGDASRVTQLPRSPKEFDEWPDLGISKGQGPSWPELTEPLLFVADTRYHQPPEFKKADCKKLGRHSESRKFYGRSYLAKWIDVWECRPK